MGEGREVELWLGRPGTSFFHFKHCYQTSAVMADGSSIVIHSANITEAYPYFHKRE